MRKLKLQMQVSVDGFNSTGPNDEQKWVTWDVDGIKQHVVDLLDSSDTILLGRKTAVDFIPYWLSTVQNTKDPLYDFATRIVRARKIVFTKTLAESVWDDTDLATGNLSDEVRRLKARDGKDMMVYGGSAFVSALVEANLVDEFHLFVNPIAIGRGASAFSEIAQWRPLVLRRVLPFQSGIVLLQYESKPER